MATIKTFKDKSAIPKPKLDHELTDPVDFNIMEYLYAATIQEILDDDALVKLINSNGFYKTCFCESFELYEIVISIDKEEYLWTRPQNLKRSNLDIFARLNKKENINDIQQYISDKYTLEKDKSL